MGLVVPRAGLSALAMLVLAACNGGLPGLSGQGDPVPMLALVGGDVVAAGPSGYCVDAKTSRPRDGLALIAACSVLSGDGALPWRNAVIAVQVGPPDSAIVNGSEAGMADFLKTDAGRDLLSVSGNGEAIAVRRSSVGVGLVTVTFTDTDPPMIPGTQSAEWRGFIDVNGRLVTVALRGLASDPLSEDVGASLLRDAVASMRSANADPS